MDEIKRNINALLDSVKNSEVYRELKKQEEILDKDPELKERVCQFRAKNFMLQNEANREELFRVVEQLSLESKELRRNPQVNAYLDAELATCKMMQKICRTLTEGIEMNVPEF